MAYSGGFKPTNPKKYEGDADKITFRSLWERRLMKWADQNPDVVAWSSEEIIIPYYSPVTCREHRYFMDFKVTFKSGQVMLIEVKPKYQTVPPEKKQGKTQKRFLAEAETFAVNDAKWKAAQKYAEKRGWQFMIFTEDTFEAMNMPVVKKYKKRRPKSS